MTSARLFSDKLNNLQKELEELRTQFRDFAAAQNHPLTINSDIEHRLSDCETKINQLIDEITPILSSHATALKEILATLKK